MGNRKLKDLGDLSSLIPENDEEVSSDDAGTLKIDDTFSDVIADDDTEVEDSEAVGDVSEAVGAVDDDYSTMDDFEDNWGTDDDASLFSNENREDSDIDFGDEAGWAGGEKDENPNFDATWFVPDEEALSEEDDGQEGPAKPESFEFDEGGMADLNAEWDNDPDTDVFSAMQRMDIALSEEKEEDDEIDELPMLDVSVSFLGPRHGALAAAVFYQGTPIGVGEGLFVLDRDGMFYSAFDSIIEDMKADSVAWHKDTIFIGTQRNGVLVTSDMGKTFKTANSWYTEGFVQKDDMGAECSTSFTITGHFHPQQFRLFGLTGEGQLYVSEDGGASWRGLLLKGCCAPLAVSTFSTQVFALTLEPSRVVTLHKTLDLDKWDPVPLPPRLSRLLSTSNGVVAASRKAVAVAPKNGRSVFLSQDSGLHFTEILCPAEVTAVLLNRESNDIVTIGVTAKDGSGHILITFDRGRNWHIALSVEPSAEVANVEFYALSASVGQQLRILTVSSLGAHLISFPNDRTKH